MNIPVIIGSGISGLAMSRRLSQCNISHHLIGKPLSATRPQLGESMDPVCSLEILEKFGDLKQSFYQKRRVVFYTEGLTTVCPFNFSENPIISLFHKILRLNPAASLVHVDRAEFDQHVFQKTIASSYCHYQECLIKSLDYDAESDRISELYLENGQSLHSSYIFDCSNHIRLLPRLLKLPVELLGKEQKVAFTHFGTTQSWPSSDENSWLHATHVIKTERQKDGLDGFGWCIPLGNHISVGISCDAQDVEEWSAAGLLALFLQALSRRGINITDMFEQKFPEISIRNTCYYHEHFAGKNWLLAGSTACQIWFPSGSAVGLSLFLASMADQFLRQSSRAIVLYTNYLNSLKKSHGVFDSMRYQPMDHQSMKAVAHSIFIGGGMRLCDYAEARGHGWERVMSALFRSRLDFIGRRLNFCTVQPIQKIPEPIWQPQDKNQEIVTQVMNVVSGNAELKLASTLIAPKLIIHISGSQFQGIQFWYLWLKIAQWMCPYQGFQLCPLTMDSCEDRIQIKAEFRAEYNGRLICSEPFNVIHRICQGEIVEMFTDWKNYEFIFQPQIFYRFLRFFLPTFLKLLGPILRLAPMS